MFKKGPIIALTFVLNGILSFVYFFLKPLQEPPRPSKTINNNLNRLRNLKLLPQALMNQLYPGLLLHRIE